MANSSLVLLSLLLLLLPLSLLLFFYLIVRPRPVKVSISNRHVFITGGSSGIGLALALQAAAEGAKVSILARNAGKLEDAKHAILRATGCGVAAFSADVRDYDAVKRAVEEAGPIDVLVCNHGVYASKELENQEVKEVKMMIDVNLTGTFHLIKAALPGMISRPANRGPGSIAIISSQAGQARVYAKDILGMDGEQSDPVEHSKNIIQIASPENSIAGLLPRRELHWSELMKKKA
ncbi:PREDICTED: 3-dehydrosphinganine reductase TSC10A-like [Ipomoea nil]|uniref:3-dehydrosphinganine reductase TSC10A-like n=1 Tax=Ipomoea nil TaxID=35883 RepID=UPI0009019384|nr:PREDICTED: 3-dehydrosphinganine reductase TSC10A-like [Ipomoea nil]